MISDNTTDAQFPPQPIVQPKPSFFAKYMAGLRQVLLYFGRAAQLNCPVCGLSPIFPPYYEFKGVLHWYKTLPRCPECDHTYRREPGYFLTAIWFVNMEILIVFGIFGFVILDQLVQLSLLHILCFNTILSVTLSLASIRHMKAFFMAFDLLVDPLKQDDEEINT